MRLVLATRTPTAGAPAASSIEADWPRAWPGAGAPLLQAKPPPGHINFPAGARSVNSGLELVKFVDPKAMASLVRAGPPYRGRCRRPRAATMPSGARRARSAPDAQGRADDADAARGSRPARAGQAPTAPGVLQHRPVVRRGLTMTPRLCPGEVHLSPIVHIAVTSMRRPCPARRRVAPAAEARGKGATMIESPSWAGAVRASVMKGMKGWSRRSRSPSTPPGCAAPRQQSRDDRAATWRISRYQSRTSLQKAGRSRPRRR